MSDSTRDRAFDVTLPIGYSDEHGRWHRRARIRKLRGSEEELFYDPQLRGADLVTRLIQSCLVQLGELEAIDETTIADFYSADRNYLLLELQRITFGDHVQAHYLCPTCHGDVAVTENLADIEVRRLGDGDGPKDIVIELEDGYEDRGGTVHKELVMRLPKGADEAWVAPMIEKDALKARDALLLRCIKSFGTLSRATLEAYGVKILRDLTLGDRRRLHNAHNGGTPGIDFQRRVRCPDCGIEFAAVLDVTDFFALN